MALFTKPNLNPIEEVKNLKAQGYSDNQIIDELKSKGIPLPQINDLLAQSAIAGPEGMPPEIGPQQEDMGPPGPEQRPPMPHQPDLGEELYGRIEEISEGIIDEKWELLVSEVKKIVEWKEKVEGQIEKLNHDTNKLNEDFKQLHQGVLGKLEDYDGRMSEVGTELKAVSKVFKDVIPEFVENVKELKSVTGKVKKK